jgi:hypothetical protein
MKKVWDYGFGIEVETHFDGDPHNVTNRNDEAYNVYDPEGRFIKTIRRDESCEIYKMTCADRVFGYLVHVDSLMTTVIWKKKATMLKGLPEVIGKRYRVEKAKWIETLKVMKEMHLQFGSTTDIGCIHAGIVTTLLSEQGVTNRNGFVVNIKKMHKALPLITMDDASGRADFARARVWNADRKRRLVARNEVLQPFNTSTENVNRWFSEKGWTKEGVFAAVPGVPVVEELKRQLYDANGNLKPGAAKEFMKQRPGTQTLGQLIEEMDQKQIQELKDLCDKLLQGSQDVTVVNGQICPVKHLDDGEEIF